MEKLHGLFTGYATKGHKKNYLAKLETSKKVWSERGGARSEATILELEAEGAAIERTGGFSNQGAGDKEVIKIHDYLDDTTSLDFSKIPTYKRMCICIMKNDHLCKYMGFGQNKIETERRSSAETRYKNANA